MSAEQPNLGRHDEEFSGDAEADVRYQLLEEDRLWNSNLVESWAGARALREALIEYARFTHHTPQHLVDLPPAEVRVPKVATPAVPEEFVHYHI